MKDVNTLVVGSGNPGYELKEWVSLAGYLASFPDRDGNGLPDLPERYRGPEGRITVQPSWNPIKLISGGNAITYGVLVGGILVLAGLVLLIRMVVKKWRGGVRTP